MLCVQGRARRRARRPHAPTRAHGAAAAAAALHAAARAAHGVPARAAAAARGPTQAASWGTSRVAAWGSTPRPPARQRARQRPAAACGGGAAALPLWVLSVRGAGQLWPALCTGSAKGLCREGFNVGYAALAVRPAYWQQTAGDLPNFAHRPHLKPDRMVFELVYHSHAPRVRFLLRRVRYIGCQEDPVDSLAVAAAATVSLKALAVMCCFSESHELQCDSTHEVHQSKQLRGRVSLQPDTVFSLTDSELRRHV